MTTSTALLVNVTELPLAWAAGILLLTIAVVIVVIGLLRNTEPYREYAAQRARAARRADALHRRNVEWPS